jgi:hypothetical protein
VATPTPAALDARPAFCLAIALPGEDERVRYGGWLGRLSPTGREDVAMPIELNSLIIRVAAQARGRSEKGMTTLRSPRS